MVVYPQAYAVASFDQAKMFVVHPMVGMDMFAVQAGIPYFYGRFESFVASEGASSWWMTR